MTNSKFFVITLWLLPLLSACSTGNSKQMPRTVPVVAETAESRDIPLEVRAIGNVEAFNSVSIKAQTTGEVAGVFFQEGQDVKKDDLLFKIDARPYEAALKQAEAALARNAAQARNAEEQAKRYAVLVDKDYVSRDQYDQLRANADALAAAVESDRANVEAARLQLAFCTIRSPINGRAGSVLVNAGNVVKANDVTLTTINQLAPIHVVFSVPERDLAEIEKHSSRGGLMVEAVIPGDEAHPARGRLTFIDNEVDKTTGTIRLKATFDNSDRRLWPGQFADVVLTLTTEHGRTVVPSQAVQTGQQGRYVYVIGDDMTAELRVVTPGRSYQKWTIVDKGVSAGERVVTEGQLRLTPGARVEIKNETSKSQITKPK